MGKWTRRAFLAGSGAAIGVAGARYASEPEAPFGRPYPDAAASDPSAGIVLNDASLLNPTPVAKHLVMKADPQEAFVTALRAELDAARAAGRPFALGGARHSMGGQSLARGGTAVTLDQSWLEADSRAGVYRVAAGTRWNRVIAALDTLGFSPKILQSNNDFAVAGTCAVNAHGWPVPFGPFGSSLRSLRLMLPDGEVVRCARDENPDLFAMTLGGYGLTGVIIDLELEMVPNARLAPTFEVMPAGDLGKRFAEMLSGDGTVQMAYGRLDVSIKRFFEEGLLVSYRPTTDQDDLPDVTGPGLLSRASRPVLRGQVGSERTKSLRWFLETELAPQIGSAAVTRNALVNVPVATLRDSDPNRTDILHEYFVAPDRFAAFVEACRDVIPSSFQELLNITLRFVDADPDSRLAYAAGPRIAAVMLFSQEMSERGEADMARMTRGLIDRVLGLGGTYYLPYRLHASAEQFGRGYPSAAAFAVTKRRLDPDVLFRNALWDRYLAPLG